MFIGPRILTSLSASRAHGLKSFNHGRVRFTKTEDFHIHVLYVLYNDNVNILHEIFSFLSL